MPEVLFGERRTSREPSDLSPAELVQDTIDCAQRQLDDARAKLICARKRVASLQAVTANWSDFAVMLEESSRARTH